MDIRNVHQIRIIYAIRTYSTCIDSVYVYTTGQKFPDTIINLKFGALVGEIGF